MSIFQNLNQIMKNKDLKLYTVITISLIVLMFSIIMFILNAYLCTLEYSRAQDKVITPFEQRDSVLTNSLKATPVYIKYNDLKK